MRAAPDLLAQFLPALRPRLSAAARADLGVVAWSGGPSPLAAAPRGWRIRERWARREAVQAFTGGNMIFFDPVGGVVTIYDAATGIGGVWFADPTRIPVWTQAAPLLRLLDFWFAARGRLLCHGAAIAKHGGAALIVGPGGAGKSSLALHAASAGFGYLGDDYVILEAGSPTSTVHAAFASGKLAGQDLARGTPPRASLHRGPDAPDDKSFLRVDDAAIAASAPLHLVIAPRIGDHETPAFETISPAQALRAILPSTLTQLPGRAQEKLATLTRALTVPCFRLYLSRSHPHNLALIDRLLRERCEAGELAGTAP